MLIRRAAAIALFMIPLCGIAGQARGGGFDRTSSDPPRELDDVKYEPVRLPLSAKAARTWISLHETMVKPPPDATPLKDILRFVKDSTRGEDGKGEPLKVFLDQVALQEAELTMESPITSPFVGDGEVSLHTYLKFVLRHLVLSHQVHDDLIIIASPCDDCPDPVEITAERAWAWLLLHEERPLHFPEETTLRHALKTIQDATLGKRPGGRGLSIHMDPVGLKEVEKSPDSNVPFDIDRVPLCTSLGLMLGTLDLSFTVGDDGVITVSSGPDEPHDFMDEATVVESYQLLKYDYFWDMKNMKKEIWRAELSRGRTTGSPSQGGQRPQADQKKAGDVPSTGSR